MTVVGPGKAAVTEVDPGRADVTVVVPGKATETRLGGQGSYWCWCCFSESWGKNILMYATDRELPCLLKSLQKFANNFAV